MITKGQKRLDLDDLLIFLFKAQVETMLIGASYRFVISPQSLRYDY